ncbi:MULTISPECIES: sodium:solute symporter family transporter [Vibrio]|uniref:Transporter n=10 Tax=Vibrionaceae TaxID=641 RepID=A0A7Z1MGF0_9VIBR|nr:MULTISPECIES: transporter [Vibrio]KNH13460.1 transporter [Vibrio lentus]MBY7662528.1 transporter [Vibrio atlanticus]KAA8598909.1 putative sodium-solute symporter [Vibrio cyclitrophicus]MBE8557144.1 transporter [Vibrio sp. OPT24]MBE8607361.1 transporter [Vibrio sp. OPT10]|tara:strand:- start:9314 stop:11089 length:1776 start_codon:yes stop_codon:yes gene_type:complete
MELNTLIVGIYFLFLIAIGWMFRTFTSTTSDYFRGGGNMLWWMVGATAFMTQFSAWTFTGAAGKAFTDGFAVAIIFIANAFGYLMNYLYFAPKFRQLRVVTVIEAIRMRFGKVNEQVFTWSGMPNSVISAGIWLNGLAIIASGIFGFDMTTTIILTGLVVLVMSVTGGSWAVIASDFMQMVIIMAVTVTCAVVAIYHGGGVTQIISDFPTDSFITGDNLNYLSIFSIWAVFIFLKQFSITNNMLNSYRYLAAKDSNNARKAALLACILMTLGPIIWFMPSWFMAGQGVDLAAAYPEAGSKSADFAYLYFVQEYMPAGMVGLLIAAMFAATMSSMDSGLNRNSGIFVKNFYEPILRPQATEKELMVVSKLTSTFFGIAIILVALFINSLKGLSLFDTMMYVGALIGFPMTIPAFCGFFIRKTPDWAGWGTLVVGGVVSYFVGFVITADMVQNWFGLNELTGREWADLKVAIGLIGHIVFTAGFFVLSTLFYKPLAEHREKDVDKFFNNLATPLVAESNEQKKLDNKQRRMLGSLIAVAGVGVMTMFVLPNPMWGRMVFVLCGAIVFSVGLLLVKAVDDKVEQQNDEVTSAES